MHVQKEHSEDSAHPSFLDLLYSAYSSYRVEDDPKIISYFQTLDRHFSPLSENDRDAVFRTIYYLYSEKERSAFSAGIQAGIRLLRELDEIR